MENILISRAARTILFAAIGGTAGYFIGSFIAYKLTSSEYEVVEIVEEEETEETTVDPRDSSDDKQHFEQRPRMRLKDRPAVPLRDYNVITKKATEKGDLKKLASRYNGEEVKEAEAMLDEATSEEADDVHILHRMDPDGGETDPDKIRVIDEKEYNDRPENGSKFTKTTLHYYEEDDVVTDEGGEPLPHPEKILGDDALISFGEGTADPDLVHVLNPLTGDMYCVVRKHSSYGSKTVVASSRKRRAPRKDRSEDEEA